MAYKLLDKIPFGKLVVEVVENDPAYVRWLMAETGFELDDEAYARYRKTAEAAGEEL